MVDADAPQRILVLAADRGAADHHPLPGIVPLDPAADFHSREDRHLEVDEQEVERPLFKVTADPFAAVLGLVDLETFVAEKLGDERPEDSFVFHKEE